MYCKIIQFLLPGQSLQLGKCKIFQVREKTIITGFQVFILCFENVKSPKRVGHVGGPARQAKKAVVDAFPELIIIQPILLPHIREKTGKPAGEKRLSVAHLLIGPDGKGPKAAGVREFGRVAREEMVIYNVDKRSGIEAIVCPEKMLGFPGNGMGVGKSVDGPMEIDTISNGFWVVQLFFPFYKVTDQIAHGYVGYAEGQVCMCQIIHLYNLLNLTNIYPRDKSPGAVAGGQPTVRML